MPGQKVYSVDGNVSNPNRNLVAPRNSVIYKRDYSREILGPKGGRFLRPKFSAMQ